MYNLNKVPLFETLLDVKLKNASKMKDDQFFELLQYDPILYTVSDFSDENLINQQESYSRWLLKMYNNKQLVGKSYETIRKSLKSFDEIKKRKNNLPSNDINGYKSIDELQSAVETAVNSMTANQKSKQAKKDEKTLKYSNKKELGMYMDGGAELIHNGENWEVWIPHTYEGSKALGRGAGWCTASGSSDSYFGRYKNEGELYIILNKQNDKDKYQLFVNDDGYTSEFKDEKNTVNYSFRKFVHENPELLEFFKDIDQVTNRFENLDDEYYEDDEDNENDEVLYEEANIEYGVFEHYDENKDIECIKYRIWSEIGNDFFDEDEILKSLEQRKVIVGATNVVYDLCSTIISSNRFINDYNWNDTDIFKIWKKFNENGSFNESDDDVSFDDFIYVFFGNREYMIENRDKGEFILQKLEQYSDKSDIIYIIKDLIIENFKFVLITELEEYMWKVIQDGILVAEDDRFYVILEKHIPYLPHWWQENREIFYERNNEQEEILKYFDVKLPFVDVTYDAETISLHSMNEYYKNIGAIFNELFDFNDIPKSLDESINKEIQTIINLGKLKR